MQNFDSLLLPEKSKVGLNYYNIPKYQTYHHNDKFFCQKIDSSTGVPAQPHISNSNIDFELDEMFGMLINNYVLSFRITENNVSTINLICGPCLIESVQIICMGKTICEYDGFLLYILNCLHVDNSTSEKYTLISSGINHSDFSYGTTTAIGTGTFKDYYINLYNILSNLSFNKMALKSKITIRIKFRKNIEENSKESQAMFSNVCLYVYGHTISQKLSNSILFSEVDYKVNAFQKFTVDLPNGITQNVKQSVLLQGLENEVSLFMFFIRKKNDTLSKFCTTYSVESFYVEDSRNLNITNNIDYDADLLKYLLNFKLFPGTTFFNNQNIYLFSYAYDPVATIYNNKHMAHHTFKNCKLFFLPNVSSLGAHELVFYYLSPAILKLWKNGMALEFDYY